MARAVPAGVWWGTGGCAVCALVGSVALTTGRAAAAQSGSPSPAPQRVSLVGIPVAGKSQDEVRKLASEISARMLAVPVHIKFAARETHATPAKLGASIDVRHAVDAVFETSNRSASLFTSVKAAFAGPEPRDVPLPVTVTDEGVQNGLKRFSARIGTGAKNARLTKVAGHFNRTPEKPGKELDSGALAKDLQAALDAPDFRSQVASSLDTKRSEWLAAQQPVALTAGTRPAQPRITTEMLKPITIVLSSFSTGLAGSRNRIHNIELACNAIDGTVLLPGDTFSYNDTVGPRVPSAGFREAPQIVKGKLEPGTGGGVCQVSSTLYNAALLADMEIVRRQHHAFPVHYLPAGRDATVVDGVLDFRFKNRLAHPIAIDAKVVKGKVQFHVYGHPDDKREVEIVRSGISTLAAKAETIKDPKLPAGKRVVVNKAMAGHKVTVTRIVKKDGEVLRKEVLSHDFYHPQPGTIRVGTHEAVAKPKPGAKTEKQPETAPAPAPAPDPGNG